MCWGFNHVGQLGNDSIPFQFSYHSPVEVQNIQVYEKFSVSVGSGFSCYQSVSSTVCWGFASQNALGNNIQASSILFNQSVLGLNSESAVGSLSSGELHSCAYNFDGIYCWGNNSRVELGGLNNHRSIQPTQFL